MAAAKPRAAKPKSAKAAAAADAPAETIHVYPTHRRGPEDLVVSDPSGESIVITDEGADLPAAQAQQLIDFREATTEPPAGEK